MRESDEAPPSLKLVHRRDDSNLAGREGSQLGKSSTNVLPNKHYQDLDITVGLKIHFTAGF